MLRGLITVHHKTIDLNMKTVISQTMAVVIFLCFISSSSTFAHSNRVYKIATASKGGAYYPLGLSIARLLKEKDGKDFKVISTAGSVDNIFRLEEDSVDFAIVQNDIASRAANGLKPFRNAISNLRGIATFYKEPIIILTNDPNIRQLHQLADHTITTGMRTSGLNTDARIILNSSGLWDSVDTSHHNISDTKRLLDNHEVDVAFLNTINDSLQSELLNKEIFPVNLSEDVISKVTATYPYFVKYTKRIDGVEFNTIAVKCMLVCKNNTDPGLVYEITKALYKYGDSLTFPSGRQFEKQGVVHSMSLEWDSGAAKFYDEIGVMHSNFAAELIWMCSFVVALFIVVVLVFNFVFLRKGSPYLGLLSVNSKILRFIKHVNLVIIKYKYVAVLFLMITANIGVLFLVKYSEHEWALRNNQISSFDNKPFSQNLLWMFVFGGSGYDEHMFPQSPLGKVMATLIPLIGVGGFIAIISLLTSDHIKKQILGAKGMNTTSIKNHIILCGWNDTVPFLVNTLLHENLTHKRPVVILGTSPDEMPLEKHGIKDEMITYIHGDATNREDLKRANIKDADIAIIVSDHDSTDPDARNILKGLTIEQYCRELELDGQRVDKNQIYTIMELNDVNKEQLAYDAFVDEVISLGDIKSKILVESILNPGVSKFINEILTYNELNEIYSIELNADNNLLGKSFDGLLSILRKHRILLLSISLGNHKSRDEVNEIIKRYNLTRSVITNPLTEPEINYKTNVDDVLIVLAQNEGVIDEALKIINGRG